MLINLYLKLSFIEIVFISSKHFLLMSISIIYFHWNIQNV